MPDTPKVFVYQTYGLPEPIYDKAEKEVFQQYNVEVRRVTGCLVTDSLLQSIENNNKAVYRFLDKKLDTNSEEKIKAEIAQRVRTQRAGKSS